MANEKTNYDGLIDMLHNALNQQINHVVNLSANNKASAIKSTTECLNNCEKIIHLMNALKNLKGQPVPIVPIVPNNAPKLPF